MRLRTSLLHASRPENSMLDTILIAAGLGGFALTVLFVYACERL
jgi:hypothetical protein